MNSTRSFLLSLLILIGSMMWTSAAAAPPGQAGPGEQITIPLVGVAPARDGVCEAGGEYAAAFTQSLGQGTAYFLLTDADLWVCLTDLAPTTAEDRIWTTLFVSRTFGRPALSLETDYLLQVDAAGKLRTRRGAGDGAYVDLADGPAWRAAQRAGRTTRAVEYQIDLAFFGRRSGPVGLAVGLIRNDNLTGDTLWPVGMRPVSPATWGQATLAAGGDLHPISGQVTYRARNGETQPVAGVGVALYGRTDGGREGLLDLVYSDENGAYSIPAPVGYEAHWIELDTKSLPRGFVAGTGGLPPVGTKLDARTIDFGGQLLAVNAGNDFVLEDPPVVPPDFGGHVQAINHPILLIVAPESVIQTGALDEFRQYKTALGISVDVVSTKTVESEFSETPQRFNQIREYARRYRQEHGSAFQYMLLVGHKSEIPYVRLALYRTEEPQVCLHGQTFDKEGWKYSDWFYVDLTSDFDSNGNGCYGDGMFKKPESSYVPDDGILFQHDIAVGRIPFNDADTVAAILRRSMEFETQMFPSQKAESVLAMSAVSLQGFTGPKGITTCTNLWSQCVAYNPETNFDTAVLGDAVKTEILAEQGMHATTLYEQIGANAGGAGIVPDMQLERNAVHASASGDVGFVNLSGHGSANGVSRRFWQEDINGSGFYEYVPKEYTGELGKATLLNRADLEEQQGVGSAVYFLNACSTGNPDGLDTPFAAELLQYGYSPAVMAALNIVLTGSWNDVGDGKANTTNYRIVAAMLEDNLRLGDAIWPVLETRIDSGATGLSSEIAFTLFGDPTLTYWGLPGGHALGHPWPMIHGNPYGHGLTSYYGPDEPVEQWAFWGVGNPQPTTLPPSPLVDKSGRIYVPHDDNVDIFLPSGELFKKLEFDEHVFGTPAIGSDGTLYTLDAGGTLHAHWPFPAFGTYAKRWSVDLGTTPLTSPVIGADGFIAMARRKLGNSEIVLVRPDGFIWQRQDVPGTIVNGLTLDPERAIYATTRNVGDDLHGNLVRYRPFTDLPMVSAKSNGYNTAPLLANGAIYAGRVNGDLVKMDVSGTVLASYDVEGQITMGPIVGPAAQIFVGTQAGKLYSLSADLELRWSRDSGDAPYGAPVFTPNALYLIYGPSLHALHPHSGATLWRRNMGNDFVPISSGSVAVGPNRELYALGDNGYLAAFGEAWLSPPAWVEAEAVLGDGGEKSIAVAWEYLPSMDNVSNAGVSVTRRGTRTGVVIERSLEGGPWEAIATVAADATSYVDSEVAANRAYRYRVRLVDADRLDSDYRAAPTSIRALPDLPATPPTPVISGRSAMTIELTWEGVTAAGIENTDSPVNGYIVERALSGSEVFAPVGKVEGHVQRFVDDGLDTDTPYDYRLRAANRRGESPASPAASGTTKPQTLDTPVRFEAQLQDGATRLTWSTLPAKTRLVIEHLSGTADDYVALATLDDGDSYLHRFDEEPSSLYRAKFVTNAAESPYVEVQLKVDNGNRVYMPFVVNR